jgi:hypothetical protein
MARKSQRRPKRIQRRRTPRASAANFRSKPNNAATKREIRTAFDAFGSDLPDEAFDEIFDQPRQHGWREIEFD